MATELKTFNWIDDGKCDMQIIVDNMETLRAAIDEVERLRAKIESVKDIHPPNAILAVESYGDHKILSKGTRSEMKISQVFIVAGGVSDSDINIELFKNGVDELLDNPIILKSTENTGKLKIGNVLDYITISQFDEIYIKTDGSRKFMMTIVFDEV